MRLKQGFYPSMAGGNNLSIYHIMGWYDYSYLFPSFQVEVDTEEGQERHERHFT